MQPHMPESPRPWSRSGRPHMSPRPWSRTHTSSLLLHLSIKSVPIQKSSRPSPWVPSLAKHRIQLCREQPRAARSSREQVVPMSSVRAHVNELIVEHVEENVKLTNWNRLTHLTKPNNRINRIVDALRQSSPKCNIWRATRWNKKQASQDEASSQSVRGTMR